MSEIDDIVSKIVELSLEQPTKDPVSAIHAITIMVNNKIEAIMYELREQERLIKRGGGENHGKTEAG